MHPESSEARLTLSGPCLAAAAAADAELDPVDEAHDDDDSCCWWLGRFEETETDDAGRRTTGAEEGEAIDMEMEEESGEQGDVASVNEESLAPGAPPM
jgi:hypothetical protein